MWNQCMCGKVCFRLDCTDYLDPHINAGLTKEPGNQQGLTVTSSICLMPVGFICINCSVSGDLNSKTQWDAGTWDT